MTGLHWLMAAIGVGVVSWPAWKSVRCLIKARQLLRWRRPVLKGLDGQRVTLRGEVRVSESVRTRTDADCLWHRHVVRHYIVHDKSSSMKTVSDVSQKAKFSIVVGGSEFVVADLPTHVYGANYSRAYSGDKTLHSYWLPVVKHLTVLGRVRQNGSQWKFVKDPKVGLIYSIHTAENTALREVVKAGVGLAVVGAGVLVFYLMLTRLQ